VRRWVVYTLLVGLPISGCASAYNAAQWRATTAFHECAVNKDAGQSYVNFDPAKDGTLYYTPLLNPGAQAKVAECLRTKYPDLNVVAGPRPEGAR
jgi:hypothetical protein